MAENPWNLIGRSAMAPFESHRRIVSIPGSWAAVRFLAQCLSPGASTGRALTVHRRALDGNSPDLARRPFLQFHELLKVCSES